MEKMDKMDKATFDQLVAAGKLVYHHTSIARGYLRVGDHRYNNYTGKFGFGVVESVPTLRSCIRGMSHHFIKYYLYV